MCNLVCKWSRVNAGDISELTKNVVETSFLKNKIKKKVLPQQLRSYQKVGLGIN